MKKNAHVGDEGAYMPWLHVPSLKNNNPILHFARPSTFDWCFWEIPTTFEWVAYDMYDL